MSWLTLSGKPYNESLISLSQSLWLRTIWIRQSTKSSIRSNSSSKTWSIEPLSKALRTTYASCLVSPCVMKISTILTSCTLSLTNVTSTWSICKKVRSEKCHWVKWQTICDLYHINGDPWSTLSSSSSSKASLSSRKRWKSNHDPSTKKSPRICST